MKDKIEQYLSEIPAELQDKARACKDTAELNEFAAENDIELTEEALEMVAGGCGGCPEGGDHEWVSHNYYKECK
ncbi:MAG: hypothetical protein K6B74_10540, partial [Ruminococcus sp.]|nr:hypothetical protein [Ruminococcus sp.]